MACITTYTQIKPTNSYVNKPTSPEMVEKSLAKLGGTPFYLEKINIDLDDSRNADAP